METITSDLIVVGGGLAGCEAAWQAASRDLAVTLYEMRPRLTTGAHNTSQLAELVCSNSLGSTLLDRPSGLLLEELRRLGSFLVNCAEQSALPAGGALAVDREGFAALVTNAISNHPKIKVIREEYAFIPNQPAIIASGPLTSPKMAASIQQLTGQEHLFFFDAIAPIVFADSINMEVAFRGSRYQNDREGAGDYINCPMTSEQYSVFVEQLLIADRIRLRDFETDIREGIRAGGQGFFEGCLPIEVLAERGGDTLSFGPMRPIGLRNVRKPASRVHAVLQLRQDDLAGSLYNLVGCQTNLTFSEQRRVFRLVPGLEKAEFARYGQMHRNTYIASPRLLLPTLQSRDYPDLFFAGQITGVEGYMGNIATGWLAGVNAVEVLNGRPPITLPETTMLGALCHYISHANLANFQPMKANFGIMPPVQFPKAGRRERALQFTERALNALNPFIARVQKQTSR